MVEKRTHPLIALFINHLMYACLSFIIVTSMTGNMQTFFGIFFLVLYLFGIYGYAQKAGNDHQKSYSKVKPHVKFPLGYAAIGVAYLVLPLCLWMVVPHWVIYLLATFWDAPFYFAHIVYNDGVVNFIAAGIFSVLIIVVTLLGYWAGVKRFHLMTLVHQLLYRPVKEPTQETKKEQ